LSAFQPSNIFFSLDGQIRIGDFGLVTDMADIPQLDSSSPMANHSYNRHTQQVGTQLYMSPEQIQGLPYNYKVDIYSLGLILFELLVCFSTEMERIEVLKGLRISEFPKDFQEAYPDEVSFGFDKLFKIIRLFLLQYELLRLMLSQSPKERPTTFGIRARPPLCNGNISSDKEGWHFELPPRRRGSRSSTSLSQSSSSH
jgi:eukaryotic translation initiation factor 2-alpha kinase 3